MMFKKYFFLFLIFCCAAHAEVSVLGDVSDDASEKVFEIAKKQADAMKATPRRKAQVEPLASARLKIDGDNYTLFSFTFMAKTQPDEVCTPVRVPQLAYRCEEGPRFAYGCHLMFFDAQGKWVGFHTMQIKEGFPHFCNAMPAIGVANKANNELLVTMQYFSIDGEGAKEISEIGTGWFRMTSLFRVKAVNGKIEVEQDDACLGNPNRIDNIPDARKRLRQCGVVK